MHGSYDADHCDFNGNDSINIFLGDGKGHFAFKTSYQNIRTTDSAGVIGDFNHDGKPDLAVIGGSFNGCAQSPDNPPLDMGVLVSPIWAAELSPSSSSMKARSIPIISSPRRRSSPATLTAMAEPIWRLLSANTTPRQASFSATTSRSSTETATAPSSWARRIHLTAR